MASTTHKNAGTYITRASGLDANYNLSFVNGSMVIAKANATVTANSNTALTYNGANQTVSGFSASGLQGGETASVLTGVTASTTRKNAGTYSTSASGSDGNYNLSFVNGSMVIAKANLTEVTASKTDDGLSTVTYEQMTSIRGVYNERFTASAGTATISVTDETLTDLRGLTLESKNGGDIENYNLASGLPPAGEQNFVLIKEAIKNTDTTPPPPPPQSVSNVPPSPVVSAPTLPSNTSSASSAQLARNTQLFSGSFGINTLFPSGAGTAGNFVNLGQQDSRVILKEELADRETVAVDSVGGNSTNSPSSSAPGARSGDTSSEAASQDQINQR
jgi:hypothetical protein